MQAWYSFLGQGGELPPPRFSPQNPPLRVISCRVNYILANEIQELYEKFTQKIDSDSFSSTRQKEIIRSYKLILLQNFVVLSSTNNNTRCFKEYYAFTIKIQSILIYVS
eukprot:TRINITY_DN2963_c2_g3_i3.p7 TRINITY_DN2963_c2_g3~~TRINITY_DN2963_c2_g3_i3.p7  ORF type:complete len:109 (-),score=0.85 TRINITY_DN2963_c2_g3_i3:931-1257(-)